MGEMTKKKATYVAIAVGVLVGLVVLALQFPLLPWRKPVTVVKQLPWVPSEKDPEVAVLWLEWGPEGPPGVIWEDSLEKIKRPDRPAFYFPKGSEGNEASVVYVIEDEEGKLHAYEEVYGVALNLRVKQPEIKGGFYLSLPSQMGATFQQAC